MDTDPTIEPDLSTRPLPPREPASPDAGAPGARGPAGSVPGDWVTVVGPGTVEKIDPALPVRRLMVQLAAAIAAVLVVVGVAGALAAQRLAEREAVNDAASMADVLAEAVVQPSLTNALLDGDPAALARFDRLVRARVLGDDVVRLKIWTANGVVAYSDQPAQVGVRFGLDDDQLAVLDHPQTRAEISDLSEPENVLDREQGNKLVEVYRPVWTPTNREALFEIYTPYDQVSARSGQLWRGFAGVTLSSLLLFVVLLFPIFWRLLTRARRAQRQREQLLQRAVDASADERRRIAASLHDGPVQDLAATSFVVAGASARAENDGQQALVAELGVVSGSVRTSIRALRSLLVDIYPPSLATAGLGAALADLAQSGKGEGQQVRLRVARADELDLTDAQQRLVFRIAQETVRNAAKHAGPCTLTLALARGADDRVVLDVVDDGAGFVPSALLARPEPGHFGLALLADAAAQDHAELRVASAPGRGTHWRLRLASETPYARPEEPADD